MATAKRAPLKNSPPVSRAPQPKILRIGVIQAGKIIEERLIRRRENVTIGASPRNTIVVPASTLPRTFTLFEIQGGQYKLKFSESMDGRISLGTQVMSLDQIRKQNMAQAKGRLLELALNESSRGKVLLGEIVLLFQFVTPPPIQPRPQLPPSVRGGFFTNIDWVLASSFITLAVIHFGFLLYLRTLDFPTRVEPDVIPDSFAEYIPEVKQPKVLDVSQLAKQGEKTEEKVAEKKGTGGDAGKRKRGPAKPCDKACQEARAAARRARLVSRMGVLKLLGTKGRGEGNTANLIGAGDPGADMARAFSGVGGLTTAGRGSGAGGGLRGKGGGGTGRMAGIGDLGGRVGGPGSVKTGGMVKERVPRASVKQSRSEISGTMNSDAAYRTIRRGMSCIQACYQRTLKRSPKAAGKVAVCINVNAMGKVGSINVDQDSVGDPTMTACIRTCIMRWRFPPPEDGSAEICAPFLLQPSN
ncbi:MAG: AgmX/PglI C-terminal domain-containing protein [Anaerolineae bacterium]